MPSTVTFLFTRISRRILSAFVLFALTAAFAQAVHGQRGYMGAQVGFMDPMTSSQYGLNQGAVVVAAVQPGGPAENAGLRPGDILTSMDGVPMRNASQVVAAIQSHKPGDKARVGIIHPMGTQNISLEIILQVGQAPATGIQAGGNNGQQDNRNNGQQGGYNRQQDNGGGYAVGASGEIYQTSQAPTQSSYAGARSTAAAVPITAAQIAQPSQQGPCRAMLPAGWQLQPGPNGQTADVLGPNGAHASWGIVGVNPAMRRFYGDLYGPPDTHASFLISQMVQARSQFTSTQNVGGFFTAHDFQAGNTAGIVLYHVYPAPMGQYIISEYFAWAPGNDAQLLSQAEAVMTSLQCTSSMRPADPILVHPTSGVPDRKKSESGESGDLKDYNSTLGTQYAHDSTGRTYFLDRASQWSETGPDGPGYYAGQGVNRVKLTPGLE